MSFSEIALEIENVRKSYGVDTKMSKMKHFINRAKGLHLDGTKTEKPREFVALSGVSFQIKKGERVGIIGRNGSGKSTLLKLIQGVSSPTQGRIKSYGAVIGGLIELTAGFLPDLTGRENVIMGAALMGLERKQAYEIVDWVFELSELEKFKDTAFKNYSSGMKIRLGFCLALVTVPDIVLMDEVLAVGDAAFRKKSQALLEQYLDGRTLILVSHSMHDIKSLCDRCIVLEQGNVVFDGDVDNAIETYNQLNGISSSDTNETTKSHITAGSDKRGLE